MSVGQLLAMKPYARAKAIAALPAESRLKLAHLANLGISREIARIAEYQDVLHLLTHEGADS